MINRKTQLFFENETLSANNQKQPNQNLPGEVAADIPTLPIPDIQSAETRIVENELKTKQVAQLQKKNRSGSGSRVPRPAEIIQQVFDTLRQIKVKEFLGSQKREFMTKLKESNLIDFDTYRVTRLKPTEEIKELNGRRLDFSKFIKIFNRIADYELINLKGQKLFQIDAYTVLVKAIREFIREGVEQATKEVQESLKVTIEKPNIKNIFYTEHNHILQELIGVFQRILSQLEEIDLGKKSEMVNMVSIFNRQLDKIKSSAKILSVNRELMDEMNEKSSVITKKHLRSFQEACQVLEKGFDELQELIEEIEKMERRNEINYQRIYKSYYEPVAPIFEASPVDLVKDWLATSTKN